MAQNPPTTSSVEQAFRPAFEEIARRKAVAAQAASQGAYEDITTYFDASEDATNMPFEVHDQEYFLVSLGTAILAARPVDMTKPCMRVIGGFATKDDCRDHASVVLDVDPESSLLITKRNEWLLLPQTEAARDDPEENARRLEERLQAHRLQQAEDGETFVRAVRTAENGPRPSARRPRRGAAGGGRGGGALVYNPRPAQGGAEVRGQMAAAVCVVPDPVGGECLVKVLGCFENTAEAENWVRNVATRHVTDDDVCITGTCDWFFPNGETQTAGREHYRHKELQRIMDAAANNPKAVKRYKDWKREQDELKAREEAECNKEEDADGNHNHNNHQVQDDAPQDAPPEESLDQID